MPNHVINYLYFEDCDEEDKEKIFDFIKGETEGEKLIIDFNSILRMPEELLIDSGSPLSDGIELYMTSKNPEVDWYGKDKMSKDSFEQLEEKINKASRFSNYNMKLSDKQIKEMTRYKSEKDILKEGNLAVSNLLKYGFTDWYGWRCSNWGTKWNAYDQEKLDDGVIFQTAWSAPIPVVTKLSSIFPEVRFHHYWADEDIGSNCGEIEYYNEEICGGYIEDYGFAEKLAKELWEINE